MEMNLPTLNAFKKHSPLDLTFLNEKEFQVDFYLLRDFFGDLTGDRDWVEDGIKLSHGYCFYVVHMENFYMGSTEWIKPGITHFSHPLIRYYYNYYCYLRFKNGYRDRNIEKNAWFLEHRVILKHQVLCLNKEMAKFMEELTLYKLGPITPAGKMLSGGKTETIRYSLEKEKEFNNFIREFKNEHKDAILSPSGTII